MLTCYDQLCTYVIASGGSIEILIQIYLGKERVSFFAPSARVTAFARSMTSGSLLLSPPPLICLRCLGDMQT